MRLTTVNRIKELPIPIRVGFIIGFIHLLFVIFIASLILLSGAGTEAVMVWGIFVFIDYPIFDIAWEILPNFYGTYNYMHVNFYSPLIAAAVFGTIQYFIFGNILGYLFKISKWIRN